MAMTCGARSLLSALSSSAAATKRCSPRSKQRSSRRWRSFLDLRRRLGQVLHGRLARVEDLEDRVELRDLEQGQDAVRRLDQSPTAAGVLELLQVADQLAETGRVHVVDRFEVDHHRAGLV